MVYVENVEKQKYVQYAKKGKIMESQTNQPGTTNIMTQVEPQTLPAAYTKLGVTRGYSPYPADQLRMFIVGPSGQGKTTFISGCPRNLVLDFEGGAPGVINPTSHRLHIPNYAALEAIVALLKQDARNPKRPFDRVTFDTIDQFTEMMNPVLAEQKRKTTKFDGDDITTFGGEGAGWAILKNGVWRIITELQHLGYTWTCIGHITVETKVIAGKSIEVPRPVLFPSFARLIGRNSEVFASIYSRIGKKKVPITHGGKPLLDRDGSPQMRDGNENLVKVYMDCTTIASEDNVGTGKLRGVPTMTKKLELPDPLTGKYGWDTFVQVYNEAVASVKEQSK